MLRFINTVVAVHQTSVIFLLHDNPTAREKRLAQKWKLLLAPYNRSVSVHYGPPVTSFVQLSISSNTHRS